MKTNTCIVNIEGIESLIELTDLELANGFAMTDFGHLTFDYEGLEGYSKTMISYKLTLCERELSACPGGGN